MTLTRLRPTVAVVDLDAIRHNVQKILPKDAELLAVVKANGYAHGAVPVARTVLEAGADRLGVALVEEGQELRAAGIDAPILCLSECPIGSEVEAIAAELTLTVYSEGGLERLASAAAAAGRLPTVHVKVDTGMHRVGVYPPEDLVGFMKNVRAAGFEVEGVWTHFARAEDDGATTAAQLERFHALLEELDGAGLRPPKVHAANSAATVLYPETHFDIVRPGLALFGMVANQQLQAHMGLRPALSWRSAVSFAKRLPVGESVSYGHTFTLEHDSWIATVPVGYADGYSRRLSNTADVLIGGKRRPVVGSVTMDQCLVDCGDDEIAVGDEVMLLGRQGDEEVTAWELAEHNGTIAYEVLCSIGERVPREYTGKPPAGGLR